MYFENIFSDDFNSKLKGLSDGTLRTEDSNSFEIHKIVLAHHSKYFYAMFCGMGKGKNDVLIPGIKGEVLSNILSYIYTGNIHITEQNICDLIIASDYLILDKLLLQLKSYLERYLSINNCLSIFVDAMQINRDDVLGKTFRFIQTHFELVLRSEQSGFGALPLEALKLFLSNRNLCVESELSVWTAIVKWTEANDSNRLCCVPDLMMYLTAADIDDRTATEILEHNIVAKNQFCVRINQTKSNSANDNLKIVQDYIKNNSKIAVSQLHHRQPERLFFIARYYCTHHGTDGMQIYVTYDEKIDLWRKILDIELSFEYLLTLNGSIYMFRSTDSRHFRYNVMENDWDEFDGFRLPRHHYAVVELNGLIYVLGGISDATDLEIFSVEVYDPEMNIWFDTTPMFPVKSFAAVSMNEFIYVVGCRRSNFGYETVAEVYDSRLQTWSMLPSLSRTRFFFALAAYHEKIFVIGGKNQDDHLRDVEVFDPEKNEWHIKDNLPYIYYLPKALVLDEKLIVFDNHLEDRSYLKTNPPVTWNVNDECWETFDESSPINNLYMYNIFSLEDNPSIHDISMVNRDPATSFDKSPFSE